MNKMLKTLLCVGVGGAMLLSVGCKGCGDKSLDTETRWLKLSTGALDGNFNPFFYTAQNDGNMIGNTQIAMITTDETGAVVCGQNQPTAVLDYRMTYYDSKTVGQGSQIPNGSKDGRTEYEFVIKNGVKFSDGKDLTIKDVLFNLYVYLDPAYTGSSTIYSTDIQGLKAYRAQDPNVGDDYTGSVDQKYIDEAQVRINALIDWSNREPGAEGNESDRQKVLTAFKEELKTDWTSVEESWRESYKDTHTFTATWQAYLFGYGFVEEQYRKNANNQDARYYNDVNGNGKRDEGEKYYTTLDPWQPDSIGDGIGHVGETRDQELLNAAQGKSEEELKNYFIDYVYNYYSEREKLAEILLYWQTGYTILQDFTNEQRKIGFENSANKVESISGVTNYSATGSDLGALTGWEMHETFVAGESYDVLKIVINGIDPKAVLNFGFTVAPMHYYSGEYNGVHYETGIDHGVAIGDPDFFKNVLQATDKVGLPVGAGPYMAADMNGEPTKDKNKFLDGTIVSFVRNPYFETLGTGIDNAQIKLVQYKVLPDDEIMTNLIVGSIDFGMPNATPTILGMMTQNASLDYRTYRTGGYGYVGINPKKIPEYPVRQAIMKAMNSNETRAYYGTQLSERINRPMSSTSWAYPQGVEEYSKVAFMKNTSEITNLVESAGYVKGEDGVYYKDHEVDGMANNRIGERLKINFVIAGETTNHPAYLMFTNTRTLLNSLGFEITVTTSATALKDLTQGNLAVWAAAWSSSIDPDPYQIYHKDSKASSVKNWNYPEILNDTQKWSYEYNIVEQLSGKIDEGREKMTREERIPIYHECLDLIMDLAVEFPTYQRNDLCVFNSSVIEAKSLVQKPSFNMGLFDRLWEITYVGSYVGS